MGFRSANDRGNNLSWFFLEKRHGILQEPKFSERRSIHDPFFESPNEIIEQKCMAFFF